MHEWKDAAKLYGTGLPNCLKWLGLYYYQHHHAVLIYLIMKDMEYFLFVCLSIVYMFFWDK